MDRKPLGLKVGDRVVYNPECERQGWDGYKSWLGDPVFIVRIVARDGDHDNIIVEGNSIIWDDFCFTLVSGVNFVGNRSPRKYRVPTIADPRILTDTVEEAPRYFIADIS
jgi:hypothetical protein